MYAVCYGLCLDTCVHEYMDHHFMSCKLILLYDFKSGLPNAAGVSTRLGKAIWSRSDIHMPVRSRACWCPAAHLSGQRQLVW